MSMRISKVYLSGDEWDCHGWDQNDEEDAFYLEFSDFKNGVAAVLDGDYWNAPTGKSFAIRMSMKAFDTIAHAYVRKRQAEVELGARLEAEWQARVASGAPACGFTHAGRACRITPQSDGWCTVHAPKEGMP